MKQKFILEKSDIEKLRSGGTIDIAFNGGKIELVAETTRPGAPMGGYENNRIIKDNVVKLLEERKVPMRVKEISDTLGILNSDAWAAIGKLKSQKRVVGSDAGWRFIFNTSAIAPGKIGKHLIGSNGHSKGAH